MGKTTYQLVQDFSHQQYETNKNKTTKEKNCQGQYVQKRLEPSQVDQYYKPCYKAEL